MPRYEQSGEFFWTIDLDDTTIATAVGKVGSDGHTRLKRYGSIAEAKRTYDELIAEKIGQGYALVGVKPKPKPKPKPKKRSRKA